MTKQSEIINDPKYIPVLDKGFVGLVDHMGSDADICKAARVSYGAGTKTVNDDRGLIRYLVRNQHTSPLECVQVKLHLKMPIFVARQFMRHRTASLNEISLRYSKFEDEFYVPELKDIKEQSATNKQGGDGTISQKNAEGVQYIIHTNNNHSDQAYQVLLGEKGDLAEDFYDVYGDDPILTEDFNGVARETARMVLPVNAYTEFFWSQNLHNMLHLVKLREDSHAQWEIQEFARGIHKILAELFPITTEAYVDYVKNSTKFSRMEMELLLNEVLYTDLAGYWDDMLYDAFGEDENKLAEKYGLSKREMKELKQKLGLNK